MGMNILGGLGTTQTDVLNRLLSSAFIIEYGIIKDIPADGIVTVEMSVAKREDSVIITNCVYANLSSSAMTISMKPVVDDKVVVLFPRRFAGNMFSPESNEVIISQCGEGYSITGGIAFPMNQWQKAYHKNFLEFDKGSFDFESAYDKDAKKNLLSVKGGADGSLEVKSNSVEIGIDKNNNIEVKNGKATVSIDKDGNVTIDAQGKLDFKNQGTSLQKVIDGLATELENLTTVGSPSAQATSPASKGTIATWRTAKLNTLLKS